MIRRPPRSTQSRSSAASDVYKRQTQYRFPFQVIYPATLDAGDLASRFDVIVLEDGIVRESARGDGGRPRLDAASVPAEFRDRLGAVTDAQTIPQLSRFLEGGGTVIAIGTST